MSKFSIALRLFIITAVSALLLALANNLTQEITVNNQKKALEKSLAEALPSAKTFEFFNEFNYKNDSVKIKCVYKGYSDEKKKDLVGYVVETSSMEGYGGEIGVIVGVDTDNKITKVVISSPFSETPGLGAKAKDGKFLNQFSGKSGIFTIGSAGDDKKEVKVQAISSATITSKAVTSCVNAASEVVDVIANAQVPDTKDLQETYNKIDEKSNIERENAENSHKDEPNPTIAKEEEENE